eukprot:928424-Pelagomonas_calceolata.AAC.1
MTLIMHDSIIGNKCADADAKYQATKLVTAWLILGSLAHAPADSIFTYILVSQGGPKKTTYYRYIHSSCNPKITYLSKLQNALESHMHAKHRLKYANPKTGYYSYYQNL